MITWYIFKFSTNTFINLCVLKFLVLVCSFLQAQYPSPQFTEEFDFVAMNEKFKKEEVWSSLAKATTKIEGVEDIEFLNLGERGCHKSKVGHGYGMLTFDKFLVLIS